MGRTELKSRLYRQVLIILGVGGNMFPRNVLWRLKSGNKSKERIQRKVSSFVILVQDFLILPFPVSTDVSLVDV
jgi:hypothetical protein